MSTNGFDKNKPEEKEDIAIIAQEEKNEHSHETIQEAAPESLTANSISGLKYAGFWMRFWAYLLDLVVIGSINRLIFYPVFRAFDVSLAESSMFAPIAILTALTFYLYFVLMTKFFGQTLGKMAFGIKVINLKGDTLSWGTVLFREWIGRFISTTIFVLYIVVAFLPKKQGLHDLFADTTVIHER